MALNDIDRPWSVGARQGCQLPAISEEERRKNIWVRSLLEGEVIIMFFEYLDGSGEMRLARCYVFLCAVNN